MALGHHPGGEVGAPQLAVARLGQGALQRAGKAQGFQPGGYLPAPRFPGTGQGVQGFHHGGVVAVHSQPDNMNRGCGPAAGKFHPGNQPQLSRLWRILIQGQAIARHAVVIGNRQQGQLALAGARQQFGRAQGAVGCGGMGVEVYQHNLYT